MSGDERDRDRDSSEALGDADDPDDADNREDDLLTPTNVNEWSSKRNQVLRMEGRAVIEAQRETISDIDDKAIKTVQYVFLLLGLGVSIVRIGDIEIHQKLAIGATVLWVLAILAGMITYGASNPVFGATQAYLQYLRNPGTLKEEPIQNEIDADQPLWEKDLIEEYANWIEENASQIAKNSTLLRVTQGLVFLGGIVAGFALIW